MHIPKFPVEQVSEDFNSRDNVLSHKTTQLYVRQLDDVGRVVYAPFEGDEHFGSKL